MATLDTRTKTEQNVTLVRIGMINKHMRRYEFKIYASKTQEAELERLRLAHKDLYNAALEERVSAYRKFKTSISFKDQCMSLTQIRKDDPVWRAINAQSGQVTLARLDFAFQNFFRRVKLGQKPGFPRFQGKDHFSGFGFKTNGDGFKFEPGEGWRNGTLRISGVGTMQVTLAVERLVKFYK